MKFRLVLRGDVPSHRRGTVDAKHRIRRELHPQLRNHWRQHGMLKQAWKPRERDGIQPVAALADSHARFGFRFVPLVQQGMACSLHILLLRREDPFRLFTGSGDIDGRVKTLLDGLRMPQQLPELGGATPGEDEDPFFCLLEDDQHVFDLSVETDRLLIPPEPEASDNPHAAVAIISVHVRMALGAEFAVIGDVGFFNPY